MAQHDFNIANQGFPATRADINNAFQAIASNSSGPTAPSTTYANQWWYDTTNDKMYLRNAADSAWIEVAVIDQTNNEWKITSGVIQAVDGDGIVLKTDDGITRFTLDDTGNATFAEGTDIITGSAGTDNVRIGAGAGDAIQSGGDYNVAVGTDALTANTTASDNTAVGHLALSDNSTGDRNIAIGSLAMISNTTGSYNTAIGSGEAGVIQGALGLNTTGNYNTAVGYTALRSNTTASSNTAVGYQAGYSNTTAVQSVYLGAQAGYTSTSAQNTFLGYYCGRNNTTGHANTFIGESSGNLVTTGAKNTILGRYDGNQNSLDIRTGSNNIVLSDGDGQPRVWVDNNAKVRYPDGSNFDTFFQNDGGYGKNLYLANTFGGGKGYVVFQYYSGIIGSISANGTTGVSYNTSSDYRLKENVVELAGATDRLKQLEPKRFNFIADADRTVDGFLAHEVQSVVPEAITGEKDAVDADGNPVYQGIDQSKLVPLLVATIKELEARITALEAN